MPDNPLTLADIVKINDISVRDLGATDIFNDAPCWPLWPLRSHRMEPITST